MVRGVLSCLFVCLFVPNPEQSVCEQRGGQTQPTDRIGMHAGRVEWSSRAAEWSSRAAEWSSRAAEWSGVEQPSGVESSSRVEQ